MSAYIVSDLCIERIGTILKNGYRTESLTYFKDKIKELGFNLENPEHFQGFCEELHNLNVRAVDQRYSETNQILAPRYQERFNYSKIADLKNLSCYLYQCAEGDIPEQPLYKFLRQLEGSIAKSIVSDLPEYEKAQWGIEPAGEIKPNEPIKIEEPIKEEIKQEEKIRLSTTDISKKIKQELKTEYPKCKFSIRTEYYSGGSSISLYLMKADRRIKKRVEEITENAKRIYTENHHYTLEQLIKLQTDTNHQINDYAIKDDYDPDHWNNGVFLTEEGHKLIKRISEIANKWNWNHSDAMTDYYDVNYGLHLQLGQWDKPFIDGE